MNIIKHTYRRDITKLETIDINNIDSIALHHMDHKTATINDVTNWHIDDNRWSWIGYGYWIGFDGTIYECRGYKYINAAVKNNNSHILSIGFQGDFNNQFMTQEQIKAGGELIKYLKTILPNINTIQEHKFWNDTDCAGKNFQLSKILDIVKGVKDMNVNEAIYKLVDAKIISSPDYWLKAIDVVKNLDVLLINMAKKLN